MRPISTGRPTGSWSAGQSIARDVSGIEMSRGREQRTRFGADLKLMVIKALVVAVALAAIPAARWIRDSAHIVSGRMENPRTKIVLHYPTGWRAGHFGISLYAYRGSAQISVNRLAWRDMKAIRAFDPVLRQTAAPLRDDPVRFLTDYLNITRDGQTRSTRTSLGGRRATMVVGERAYASREYEGASVPGWGAVVVAAGPDLLYMDIWADSQSSLQAAWADWLWMVRHVRITDPAPVAPLLGGFPLL